MAYKMMAVDVDGTLLNSKRQITEETKNAIRLGVEKGLLFIICTGRPIQSTLPLLETLGIDQPFCVYNGAMIVLGKSREILYEQKLSAEDAIEIYELGERKDTTMIVWTDNKLYVNKLNHRALKYSEPDGVKPTLIEDYKDVLKNGVSKILWYDEASAIDELFRSAKDVLKGNVDCYASSPVYLEFVDKRASKGIGMEMIGKHFGIDKSEMIAVGDGYNDVSMLEHAGLGVAMANAPSGLKKMADYVTLSNDEDGVAHVIYKFVLA